MICWLGMVQRTTIPRRIGGRPDPRASKEEEEDWGVKKKTMAHGSKKKTKIQKAKKKGRAKEKSDGQSPNCEMS